MVPGRWKCGASSPMGITMRVRCLNYAQSGPAMGADLIALMWFSVDLALTLALL
jgi:hypothetical protein